MADQHDLPEEADFPLKEGAKCGRCGGPCNARGCARRCPESEEARLSVWGHLDAVPPVQRLDAIKQIVVTELKGVKPEFVSPALLRIYEIVILPSVEVAPDLPAIRAAARKPLEDELAKWERLTESNPRILKATKAAAVEEERERLGAIIERLCDYIDDEERVVVVEARAALDQKGDRDDR